MLLVLLNRVLVQAEEDTGDCSRGRDGEFWREPVLIFLSFLFCLSGPSSVPFSFLSSSSFSSPPPHSRPPHIFPYLLCSGRLLPSADVYWLSILSRLPPWVLLLPQCLGEFRSAEGGAHHGWLFMSEHNRYCRDGKRQWHQWEKPLQKLPGEECAKGLVVNPRAQANKNGFRWREDDLSWTPPNSQTLLLLLLLLEVFINPSMQETQRTLFFRHLYSTYISNIYKQ